MHNPWLSWWTDNTSLAQQATFPRLALALVLGCVIGAERQWRQRAAGLRTNALVCFGAAAFVDLGWTVGGPTTTNVIAYVISGVGFLGAGAIMKEGGSIRGLNTGATLWCSAAVGACAGAGEMLDAVFVTVLLVSINLALRPFSRWIDNRSQAATRGDLVFRLTITFQSEHEQQVSATLLRALATRPLTLRQLRTEENDGAEEEIIEALVDSPNGDKKAIAKIVEELKLDPKIVKAEWAQTTFEAD
jgi:putative Mg2+ transporter-C (MgtC) family protein